MWEGKNKLQGLFAPRTEELVGLMLERIHGEEGKEDGCHSSVYLQRFLL